MNIESEIKYYKSIRGTYHHNGFEKTIFALIDRINELEAAIQSLGGALHLQQERAEALQTNLDAALATIERVKAVKPFTPIGKGSKWVHIDLLHDAIMEKI